MLRAAVDGMFDLSPPASPGIVIVESAYDVMQQASQGRASDGMHYDAATQQAMLSLVLNAFCHQRLGLQSAAVTCCLSPAQLQPQQWFGIGVLLLW